MIEHLAIWPMTKRTYFEALHFVRTWVKPLLIAIVCLMAYLFGRYNNEEVRNFRIARTACGTDEVLTRGNYLANENIERLVYLCPKETQ